MQNGEICLKRSRCFSLIVIYCFLGFEEFTWKTYERDLVVFSFFLCISNRNLASFFLIIRGERKISHRWVSVRVIHMDLWSQVQNNIINLERKTWLTLLNHCLSFMATYSKVLSSQKKTNNKFSKATSINL